MKKHSISIYCMMAVLLIMLPAMTFAQTWDFSSVSQADQDNLNADTGGWEFDSSNNRWKNKTVYDKQPLMANGAEVLFTKGLLVTVSSSDRVRIDMKKKSFTLNGANGVVTIPNLKAGTQVTVVCQSSSSSTARRLTPTNMTIKEGFSKSTSKETNIGVVDADGDVTLTSDGGIYIYSITAGEASGDGGTPEEPFADDHSVALNTAMNQAQLTTIGNVVKYYNTSDLSAIDINRAAGTVTVQPKAGDWQDVFTRSVTDISFSKTSESQENGDIVNNGVEITEAKGWYESLYAEWNIMNGATLYNIYIKGGDYSDFTKIDQQLVRNYGTYGRADVVGLKAAGGYELKVVPVVGGSEDQSKASTVSNLTVMAYDRSGFAHHNNSGVGAYNDDGTLKQNACVIYVTAQTAKTITMDVAKNNKGETTTYTGLQNIIYGYQKGYETRPLNVRIIGTIRDTDMDELMSGEGLQVKGKNNTIPLNITIEGIGEDAAIWGFGMLLRNAVSVELRNFAVMLCLDDCISLDTDNKYCWVHHLDLFYGKTGGDADQAKGDGTIDIKGDSQYITIAYNHFVDAGKSSLCGMKSESGPNYIDYHHNWFDHSDSRHPRVRTMTVHVWNNYYDGCAKYGVGATMGSSVFVENNYFRATKNPMLISLQGTDGKGDGTFSGENGGMIKSYGNAFAEKGTSSNYTPITHLKSVADFDCYEASARNEQVPGTYKAKVGGTTYSNFDTNSSLMYSYQPIPAAEVPAKVTGYWGAGRLNKGDFHWTFGSKQEDTNYDVISALKTALQNYKSSLVGWF